MKNQVATSVGNKETELKTNGAVVLNDNGVNLMFGWAVLKVKKKYQKICDTSNGNPVRIEKELVVNNLSVTIEDVVHNQHYVQMYYPVNEVVRNRGNLTLVDPKYIKFFSNILTDIKKIMEGIDSMNNEEISDKAVIVKRLELKIEKNLTVILMALIW